MAKFHHKDPYYPNVIANGWIGEATKEVQEENPKVGLEEYQEMDYEGENAAEELDKDEDTRGILSEPYLSGAILKNHTMQEGPTDRLRSLEEEVDSLKQQLFATEARAVQAEQRVDETTREMSEMDEHLVRYFGI
ncbi:unnamed protein product [Lactuca saligna]|uniref:Uncharacterized protein n=1 Tax=Lactuca saligna TaxID=75948 RepID=A0AA35YYD7_LACSI|nr:unnamed protein product [Lactuca saligna]